MDFQDYSKAARHSDATNTNLNPLLGLAGEVGEIMELVKKATRIGKREVIDYAELERDFPGFTHELLNEIGDVLWYLDSLCSRLGLTLEDAANANIKKLASRQKAGSILERKRDA